MVMTLLGAATAHAQYVNRFTTITNGAISFTGNTLGLSKAVGLNQPGTSDAIGAFTTVDTTLQVGTSARHDAGLLAELRERHSEFSPGQHGPLRRARLGRQLQLRRAGRQRRPQRLRHADDAGGDIERRPDPAFREAR